MQPVKIEVEGKRVEILSLESAIPPPKAFSLFLSLSLSVALSFFLSLYHII